MIVIPRKHPGYVELICQARKLEREGKVEEAREVRKQAQMGLIFGKLIDIYTIWPE